MIEIIKSLEKHHVEDIAKAYGVHRCTIEGIKYKQTWKHVYCLK